MFKHPYCGRTHETVAEARHCESMTTPEVAEKARQMREAEPIRPAAPVYPARKPVSNRPFKPLGVAYAEALAEGSPEPEVNGPINKAAILAKRIDSLMNSGSSGPEVFFNRPAPDPFAPRSATAGQIAFIKNLLSERDWKNGLDSDPIARKVEEGGSITMDEARDLIPALKALPKVKAVEVPVSPKEQPWKRLSREVPAGNYCVEIEGKNHFYRVSTGKNGWYKLQERASEELHFIPLARYAGILQAILNAGIEAAHLRYSQELGRCWHCHLALTDNVGNPYFYQGLGPICGGK